VLHLKPITKSYKGGIQVNKISSYKKLVSGYPDKVSIGSEVKFFHIRKYKHFEKECQYWESKGWIYHLPATMVPISRWSKIINGKKAFSFVHKINHQTKIYGFFWGPLFKRK